MAEAPDLGAIIRLVDEACLSGRAQDGAAAMRALHRLVPDDVGVRVALARTLFRAEQWEEAWDAYDVRFRLLPGAFPTVTRPGPDGPEPVPIWRGGPQPGALLVMGEQGLGDSIQFARYLPLLRQPGRRVHVSLDVRIRRLLAPLCEGLDLLPPGGGRIAGVRHWVPLLDLPRALGIGSGRITGTVPYLRAEPDRVARMRARIGDGGLRIGIVWQGNPKSPADPNRSAPLAAFAPLAEIPGVRLFSLQKGPGEEQESPFPLDRLGPEMDNGPDWFLDTAAAQTALDLVVSICTGTVHLAGALGRPGFVILHGRHADWRWLAGRTDSPYYPSFRLVHCPDGGADWRAAVEKVTKLIRSGDTPRAA